MTITRSMSNISRLILLGLAVLLISGCGVRYAYSQLDWLVPRYVRDFVTLDSIQRAELDARLSDRLQWHCTSELPAYSGFLRDLEQDVLNGGFDSDRLASFAERAESLWRNLLVGIAPDVSGLLATFDADQVAELARRFEERNQKTRTEFLEPDEAERELQRIDRMERRLQRWLGRMNPAQREALAQWSAALEPTTEAWLENRAAWQSRLIALLQEKGESEEVRESLTGLLIAPDAAWPEDYRAAVEHNRDATLRLFARLYELADESQRQRLLRRLNSLAGQFDRVACAAAFAPSATEQVFR